ncbi:MAG: hypothetical protein HZB39_01090 [Planctomycetes bacterium]|nr:hypothetical protein [Planctomycetota bacterium]
MSAPLAPLRIGGVPYGLGAPLLADFDGDPDVALVRTTPSELVTRLRNGELDAALVSSIEGARRGGYAALLDVGIACVGPVRSVRAFRRRAVARVRSVGLTNESESSAALLRILLARSGDASPDCRFERVPSTRAPDELPHDMVLLIGDDGLRADAGAREAIDLGDRWLLATGLPFVFALWLIAPGAALERVARRLARAAAHARAIPRRADEARVHYELGDAERHGLEFFWSEAGALGLCEGDIRPRFVAATACDDDVARARPAR